MRQQLGHVLVRLRRPEVRALLAPFRDQIAEELNVKGVDFLDDESSVATYTLKPNLPALGPKLGPDLPKLTPALKTLDANEVVAQLRRGEQITVAFADGRHVTLGMDDLQPQAVAKPGYAVAEEHGYLVALATTLTPELLEEGLAREIVHRLQTMRKSAGFEVADRIHIVYDAGPKLAAAITRFAPYLQAETLALTLQPGPDGAEGYREQIDLEGEVAVFTLRRA